MSLDRLSPHEQIKPKIQRYDNIYDIYDFKHAVIALPRTTSG